MWIFEQRRAGSELDKMQWNDPNPIKMSLKFVINFSFPILPTDGRFCTLWNWYFWRKLEIFLPITNVIVGSHWVFGGKRRVTIDHFVEDNPKTPPVTFGSVPVSTKHLWSNVVRSSNGRIRQLSPSSTPAFRFAFGQKVWILNKKSECLTLES